MTKKEFWIVLLAVIVVIVLAVTAINVQTWWDVIKEAISFLVGFGGGIVASWVVRNHWK
jgi:hypothetical protein